MTIDYILYDEDIGGRWARIPIMRSVRKISWFHQNSFAEYRGFISQNIVSTADSVLEP